MTWLSFGDFGICIHKRYSWNVGEIDTRFDQLLAEKIILLKALWVTLESEAIEMLICMKMYEAEIKDLWIILQSLTKILKVRDLSSILIKFSKPLLCCLLWSSSTMIIGKRLKQSEVWTIIILVSYAFSGTMKVMKLFEAPAFRWSFNQQTKILLFTYNNILFHNLFTQTF